MKMKRISNDGPDMEHWRSMEQASVCGILTLPLQVLSLPTAGASTECLTLALYFDNYNKVLFSYTLSDI